MNRAGVILCVCFRGGNCHTARSQGSSRTQVFFEVAEPNCGLPVRKRVCSGKVEKAAREWTLDGLDSVSEAWAFFSPVVEAFGAKRIPLEPRMLRGLVWWQLCGCWLGKRHVGIPLHCPGQSGCKCPFCCLDFLFV